MKNKSPFYNSLKELFETGVFVLYGQIIDIKESESKQVLNMLEEMYNEESIGYHSVTPKFD